MLRALVLLFVMINAALYFWLQSDPNALQAEREPQRLGRQVSPDAIRVLPDLPASGARAASTPVSAASASAASDGAASAASTAASGGAARRGSSTS